MLPKTILWEDQFTLNHHPKNASNSALSLNKSYTNATSRENWYEPKLCQPDDFLRQHKIDFFTNSCTSICCQEKVGLIIEIIICFFSFGSVCLVVFWFVVVVGVCFVLTLSFEWLFFVFFFVCLFVLCVLCHFNSVSLIASNDRISLIIAVVINLARCCYCVFKL